MANLYRNLILLIFLCLPSLYSHANTFKPTVYYTYPSGVPRTNAFDGCNDAYKAIYPTGVLINTTISYQANNIGCSWTHIPPGNTSSTTASTTAVTRTQTCPAGTTDNGLTPPNKVCTDTCTATQFFNTSTGTCQTKKDCTDGNLLDSGTFAYDASNNSQGCFGGCTGLFVGSAPKIECSVGGGGGTVGTCYQTVTGRFVATGQTCNGNNTVTSVTATNPESPENKCVSAGKSYGVVNGTVVCVDKGTAGSAAVPNKSDTPKTTTSNNGAGSTVTTTYNTVINNNGTITTTTTTTTTAPNGGQTQVVDTKTQDSQGYCETNPNMNICKSNGTGSQPSSSSFAGVCGAFVCDGDAIQCAIAKKQHQNICDIQKQSDDAKIELEGKAAYTTGQKLMNNDYDQDVKDFMNKSGDNIRTVDIPSSLSESGGASFSGEGFQDYHGTVLGQSFTVPFSSSNQYFSYFGYVLLALTYLGAYRYIASVV